MDNQSLFPVKVSAALSVAILTLVAAGLALTAWTSIYTIPAESEAPAGP